MESFTSWICVFNWDLAHGDLNSRPVLCIGSERVERSLLPRDCNCNFTTEKAMLYYQTAFEIHVERLN